MVEQDTPGTDSDARRRARLALRAGLGTTVLASAAPYGYTLTIWSSGAVLIRSHGTPSVGDVFLFIVGALVGFDVLGLLARGALTRREAVERRQVRVLAAALNWIAVGAAVAAVALLAEISGWFPWLVAPLVATVVYLLGAALQLAVVAGGDSAEPR